ncbi:MAG: L-2-amino-thiazoline-4-carboxylic acid hydrolase [Peptococcaceae bacterium]
MSNLKSAEEPVVRFAKLMAELYYFMAREMIERLGQEEGREAVRAAIKNFGQARIKAMHEEAKEKGLALNDLQTFAQIRDLPMIGWETNPADPLEVTYCPMEDVWDQYGAQELGALYCEIDYLLYEGFGAVLERPACRTSGDKTCKFIPRY